MKRSKHENVVLLIKKFDADENLAKKLIYCKTFDEFYEVYSNEVGDVDKNRLKEALSEFALTFSKNNDKIMLKGNLERVSGGKMVNSAAKKTLSALMATLTMCAPLGVNINAESKDLKNVSTQKSLKETSKDDDADWKLTKKIVQRVTLGGISFATAAILTGYFLDKYETHEGFRGKEVVQEVLQMVCTDNAFSEGKYKGIRNLGNYCYMNAIIQQLYGNATFKEKFGQTLKFVNEGLAKKVLALKKIFCALDGKEKLSLGELNLCRSHLGYEGTQEDAGEFLMIKLSGVCEQIGLKHSTVSCQCSEPRQNIQKYLEDQSGEYSGYREIDDCFFVCMNRAGSNKTGFIKSENEVVIDEKLFINGKNYDFKGAVIYKGNGQTGHYYSYREDSDGLWRKYNDFAVGVVTLDEVKADAAKNGVVYTYSKSK